MATTQTALDLDVRIVIGNSVPECMCSSYLCHWENHTESKANSCYRKGCNLTTNLIGVQVINDDQTIGERYVVPICEKCSREVHGRYFKLKTKWILVRVSSRFQCVPCNK